MNFFSELDWDKQAVKEWLTGNWSACPQATVERFTIQTREKFASTSVDSGQPPADVPGSESEWLKRAFEFIGMQQDWSVLDIGAGEGLMAELMAPMAEKIVCVEPSPPRAEILRNYGYEVYESPWLETDLKEKFDLVLSCRSFGVSAISQGQPEISSSLLKMNAAARKKAVIIIPELELFKLPVSELFPDGLSRTPYLLHLGALLAMGVFPELRFFRRFYQVCYSSLEDCFLTGFGRYPWSEAQAVEIKKVLKNCITETENGFLRNREMLTSVVSWEPVKV